MLKERYYHLWNIINGIGCIAYLVPSYLGLIVFKLPVVYLLGEDGFASMG
jgi:hypothetical protein